LNRRITVEVILGVLLAAGFFWWLYFRPEPGPETLGLDDPRVLASVSKNQEKVLVIGVDGMTWDVALELMNQGRMPNLTRLFSESPHGEMHSEPPLISPAIWTTFATGRPRSAHGIDNFFARLPGQYKEVRMTSRFRRTPAVWSVASSVGRTVGVVNWNATYPAEKVNGVFVAHGISRDRISDEMIHPPEWRDRIKSLEPVSCEWMEASLQEIDRVVENSQARNSYDDDCLVYAIAMEVLKEERPDLMMVYFSGVDVVSHIYWKYRWPLSRRNQFPISIKGRDLFRDVIENHYAFTDGLIGGLLEEAGGYTVFIVSDHGMGPNYPPNNYYLVLNKLIEHLGYLHYSEGSKKEILWSATSAWNAQDMRKKYQGIFINLEGREPEGVVPAKEYEAFQKELMASLEALRTDKGKPLFVEVRPGKTKDVKAPAGIAAPDVLVETDRQALADAYIFRKPEDRDPIPVEEIRWVYSDGSGDHAPDGIFMVAGPRVSGFGKLDAGIYDIAPTILWVLGLPVGADMQGRALRRAFVESMSGRETLLINSWTGLIKGGQTTKTLEPDEKHLIQLRALGYIQP